MFDDSTLKSPFETLFAWQDDDASGFGKSGFLSWKGEGSSVGAGSGFLPVAVARRLSGC